MTRFAVGDRVVITATEHPWRGHSGVIARPFGVAGLDWVVRLDDVPGGQEAGVADNGLEAMPRRAGDA